MSAQGEGVRISHYRVVGELGRDQLGYVLRAVDESLDRPVALKVVRAVDVFPPELAAEARERFRRNAQRAARLLHPNLVTLYGYEQIGDADVVAMELVEGETLKGRLSRGDRWRALDAAAIVARIADGVAAAHAWQLVHGHLNLQNVKLRPDGRLKVLDFGIPKAGAGEMAAHTARAAAGEPPAWPVPVYQDDIAALARITCHLITGAFRRAGDTPPGDAESPVIEDPVFPDPARALANFGVLSHVLGRALLLEGQPFADAGEFRDALVGIVESGGRRPADPKAERGLSAVGTVSPLLRGNARSNPQVETEGALGALEKFAGESKSPALVLPPDLAARAPVPPSGAFVIMDEASPMARVRFAAEETRDRFSHVPWGRVVAAATVVVVLATAAVVARRITSGDASAAMLLEDAVPGAIASAPATAPAELPPTLPPAADSSAAVDSTAADSAAATRTATLEVSPPGTAIALVGADTGRWLDRAELSVAAGDSVVLRLVRRGYVPRTVVFRGEPLSVALVPDSVTVRFEANIAAQVFLDRDGAEPVLLGTTVLSARLPTGAHRFVFRAPNQDDWAVTRQLTAAGQSYTVRKADYATRGGLVATVAGGWAWVSVDGGEEHETPHRFEELPVGRHIVRLRRDGFPSVVDTVFVRGGEVVTRQYTLSRSP
jgi:hypothetical protein